MGSIIGRPVGRSTYRHKCPIPYLNPLCIFNAQLVPVINKDAFFSGASSPSNSDSTEEPKKAEQKPNNPVNNPKMKKKGGGGEKTTKDKQNTRKERKQMKKGALSALEDAKPQKKKQKLSI